MGVINATPDSFFGGSRRIEVNAAADAAASMVDAGADIVDIGGESTRPGADPVSEAQEMDRTVPSSSASANLDAVVSIDTCKAGVAAAAIRAGAQFVNDVRAACGDGMLELLAGSDVGVCSCTCGRTEDHAGTAGLWGRGQRGEGVSWTTGRSLP